MFSTTSLITSKETTTPQPTTTTPTETTSAAPDKSLQPGSYIILTPENKALSRKECWDGHDRGECVAYVEGKEEIYVVDRDDEGFYKIHTQENSPLKKKPQYWKSRGDNYVELVENEHLATTWLIEPDEAYDSYFIIKDPYPPNPSQDVITFMGDFIKLTTLQTITDDHRFKFE